MTNRPRNSSSLPAPLQRLAESFSRLPGVGHKTAERLSVSLLDWPDEVLAAFGNDLANLKSLVRPCRCCGNFTEEELCPICLAADRQRDLICVIEHPTQIAVIENTGCYRGLYHVLGGKLSPLNGKGPESLRLNELRVRLDSGSVRELILATSSDVEGEATAHYLAQEFAREGLKITRIASGLPAGSDLAYADGATLALALAGRRDLFH